MTTEISKTVAPINHLAKQDGKKKSAFSVNSNDSLISIASSKKGFHAYLWQPTICAVNVNDDRKKLPEKIVRTLPKLIKDLTSIRNRENKSVIRLSSLRKTIITSIALFEQKRIQYQQVHQQIRERKSLQQQQQQQQQQSKQQTQQQTQQQSQPESQQLQSQLKSQSLPQPQLELFEDEQFPTNRSSLYLQTDKPDPMYDSLIFKWLRIAFIKFDALPPEGDVFGAMEMKSLSESRIKIGATPATPIDSAALSVTGGAGGESRLTGRTISSMLDEEQLRKSPEIIRLLSAKYGLCVRNSKSIGVEHFRQGKLGNCWMICALACLMWHHAHHLANIIPNASLQPDGMYQIFFCLDGQWTAIEIDDQFPVDVDRRLVFAQPLANQLYAPLMEKALAKYYSSYKALNQGTVLEGFSTLTGMPLERVIISTNYNNNNNNNGRHQNKLWNRLQNCLAKQHYMIAGCCAKGIMGLFEDHAYSILDSMASLDVRALLLWNPWGKQELHGKLREANDAIQGKLPLHRLCPGMFWMRFADFVETFDYVDICKYDCDWHCKRFRFRLPRGFRRHDHFTMFEFEIPESSMVDDSDSDDSRWCRFEFTVYQEVIRDIKLQTKLEISIIIGMRSTEGDTIQFVWKSSTLVNKVGSVGKDLPPGKYLLTVVSFNHMGSSSRLKEEPQLVIAFHAARPFKVCPLQCNISLLGDLIISMAIKIGAPNECAEQCWTEYVIRDEFCAFVSVLENRNTHKDGDDTTTTTTTNNNNNNNTDNNNNNNNNNNKYNFKRSVIAWNDTRSSEHCSSLRSSRRTIDIVPPRTRQILVLMIRESDKLKFQYKKQSELCRADAPSLQFDLSQLALHPDVCKIAAIFAPRRITADTQPPPMLVSPKKKQIEKLKIAKDADDSEDGGGEKMETTTSTMSSSDSSTINDRSSLINQRSKNRYRCPNCCCCCSIA